MAQPQRQASTGWLYSSLEEAKRFVRDNEPMVNQLKSSWHNAQERAISDDEKKNQG